MTWHLLAAVLIQALFLAWFSWRLDALEALQREDES